MAKPRLSAKKPLAAPAVCKNNWLVDTAFDYLLRWHIEHRNPQASGRGWVAKAALAILPNDVAAIGEGILGNAEREYAQFLHTGDATDDLFSAALGLARLDTVKRSGLGATDIGTPADPADVADLKTLISVVPASMFATQSRCLLNPTFGKGSRMVGGADADLVLDALLVEVKTIQRYEVDRFTFDQLIGYVILSRIGGVGGDPTGPPIESIAVYLARFGDLISWHLDDLLSDAQLEICTEWFHNRITQNRGLVA